MKLLCTPILLVLSQYSCVVSAFSVPAQLTVAPRAFSTGIHLHCPKTHGAIRASSKLHMAEEPFLPLDDSTGESVEKEQLFEGLGKGIARDYKARLPLMKSDITDGFNTQVRIIDCLHCNATS